MSGAPTCQAPCPACAFLAGVLPVGDAATSMVWQTVQHNRSSDGVRCDGSGAYVPRHLVWNADTRRWLSTSDELAALKTDGRTIVDGVTLYVTGGQAGVLYTVKVKRAEQPDGWEYSVESRGGGCEVGRISTAADASTVAGILADVVRFALRTGRPT